MPIFVGFKVCTEVWDDRVATVLPGRQVAGSYKALVAIYQTTRRHTHEDCNLHLKIVRTSVLATHFGFPVHKQNCTLCQPRFLFVWRFTQTCSLERTTFHPKQRNAICFLMPIYKLPTKMKTATCNQHKTHNPPPSILLHRNSPPLPSVAYSCVWR